jgi:hypothetical protein
MTYQAGSETNSLRSNMFRFFIRLVRHVDGSVSSEKSKAPVLPYLAFTLVIESERISNIG